MCPPQQGNSQTLKKIMITVASSRQAAIDLAAADYEEEAVYVSALRKRFWRRSRRGGHERYRFR